jgi:NADPH:quinone reductase-like Zn-dependent oxidoreductase
MRALQLIDDRRLEATDIPEPDAPAPGEVTLRVKAVALNHIDVWGWRGMAFAKRKMPLTIGAEASGVVEAIGPGVSSVLPGQLVSIYGARTCGLCKPSAKAATMCAKTSPAFTASILMVLPRKRSIFPPASSCRRLPASMRWPQRLRR